MTLDEKRLPFSLKTDVRQAFISDAPIHICNVDSIKALEQSIRTKYSDNPDILQSKDVDILTFRPSFLIDYPGAYAEDEFFELRIANILFRLLGPCQRCKTTSLNWRLNTRDDLMEPYMTICKERKHPRFGPIFGTYLKPDVIKSKSDFEAILPGFKAPKDRSFGKSGIVK